MEDIAPELLARIEQEFEKRFKSDSLLADLAAKLEAGTATHAEAYEYAGRVGEILTDAYQHNIVSSSLPDGKLWYNIANRVITPTMKNNYDIISKYVTDVQTNLNKAAGLGIKAMPPDMDVSDKIQGIVNRVSSEKSYDDVKWILQEPVKTFGRNVVDSSIRTNVEFQGKAGLTPKIVRKTSGSCCKWCMALAGTYTYPDVPRDVYRRHDNCQCTVEYEVGKNRFNVHTKEKKIIKIDSEISDRYDKRIMINDKIEDVTEKYRKKTTSGVGELVFDEKTLDSDKDIARWVYKTFGGNVRCLPEVAEIGKNPDAMWNGLYWEFKKPTNVKRVDDRIRAGSKQLKEALERDGTPSNDRGIVVDISCALDSEEAMVGEIVKIVQKRCDPNTDIIIKRDDVVVQIIRVHK